VEDARQDVRFVDNPLVRGDPHIRFYAGYPLSGPGGHHVGTLCIMDRQPRTLDDGQVLVLRDLARWVEREMAHEEELDRARAVQEALLPRSAPAVSGWDVAGLCLVARNVGGDFYDWSPAAGGSLAVTVADVMGKGMGAAIVMATVRAVLRAGSLEPDPAHAMQSASAVLDSDLVSTGAFVTAFTARLHLDSSTVEYVDAGHGLAFVVGDGGAAQLTGGGPPLGVFPDSAWPSGRADIEPGGALLVCSDGVLDAFGSDRRALAAIARPNEQALLVLELTKLDRVLRAHPDVASALA
jgi:serine phosphatase RsbU (regulator of sigma subunit)